MKFSPIVFCLCCLLLGCERKPLTEPEARSAATDLFIKVCKSSRLDPSSFDGPVASGPDSTANSGFWFSYEWMHKSKEWGTLIWVRDDGEMNVSGLGEKPSSEQ